MQIINSNYVEITNKCNLNCSFCFHKKSTNVVCDNMAIKFSIKCSEKNGRLVIFGGEPFLEIQKVYEIVKAFSIGMTKHNTRGKVIIVTNGTIYDEKTKFYLSKISKLVNLVIQVSLYENNIDIQVKNANKILLDIFEGANYKVVTHFLIHKESITNVKLLTEVFEKNNLPMWLGLDRFPSGISKESVDEFFELLPSLIGKVKDKDYLFLNKDKTIAGKECGHLYLGSKFLRANGDIDFCSTIKEKVNRYSKCIDCNIVACRACTCDILTKEQREISCYFYTKAGELYV